jgi:RHS repeat-associated protein
MLTDSAGSSTVQRYDYLPFGTELLAPVNGRTTGMGYLGTPDAFDPKFTGQVRDTETGLDPLEARYFSQAQGRFTSTDPLSGWASEPQSWNRYTYGLNNPLRFIDPTGFASWDANNGWVGDFQGERDCSTSIGCLYWNSNTVQWEESNPIAPPSLFDLPGQFFVGFAALAFNNDPSELWRIPYAFGADLTGGFLLGKGLQAGGAAVRSIGGTAAAEVAPAQILQDLTTSVNAELAANPQLAATVLSRKEIAAAQGSAKIAAAAYGNAVERLVARRVAADPQLEGLFNWVSKPGVQGPDFVGIGRADGLTFDITTPGMVGAHLVRSYGSGLNIVTYTRPLGFTF